MAQVGAIYAKSLYDLSKSKNLVKEILESFDRFLNIYNLNPSIAKYLSNPIITKDQKKIFIDKVTDEVLLKNFLKVLIDKKRESNIVECYTFFKKLVTADRDELRATIFTSKTLSDEQKNKILLFLKNKTGKKIFLDEKENDSIKMGFIINISGVEIDATADSAFNRLKSELKKIEVNL